MQSIEELFKLIENFDKEEKYLEIIEVLSDELLIEHNNFRLYNYKGIGYYELHDCNKAILQYNKAIEINSQESLIYNNRGNCWLLTYELDKAIEDYDKAILLDKKDPDPYNGRGITWAEKNDFDRAIIDYSKAIELDSTYIRAYNNRGDAYFSKKEYLNALEDYNSAITLDRHYPKSYYNRALAYEELNLYNEALIDFETYLQITLKKNDFWAKRAKGSIKELKRKLAFVPYEEVSKIVSKIKELLIFTGNCITHYTALSTAKILILNNDSRLRLSEGTFLNDTSEGRVLFKELNFHITKKENKDDKSESEPFTEKPFIGSFVAETKHDDLTLWRMYGKENKEEARGCALTLNRETFVNTALNSIRGNFNDDEISMDNQFTFYNVAYISKSNGNSFIIPNNKKIENELNELMMELKNKLKGRKSRELKLSIAEKLNEIVYLFKDAEYQYENEVRLIVSGIGFPKEINFENNMGVYIYLADIRPALHKITLGPKVERAEELAATLNYFLKEKYEDSNIEIIMSHLPFK